MTRPLDLEAEFGPIDIYLFDQLLKGRTRPGMRILDAGCGQGRNLVHLLRQGHEVFGIDESAPAIDAVRRLAARLRPELPTENFRHEAVEASTFAPGSMDVVLSSAVLHFARDTAHFDAMLAGAWRLLAPGGLFFCRLASSIGMEERFEPLGKERYRLLDGSVRYLVDEERLLALTDSLGGELLDPIKTTVVQSLRCMTTWVVRKRAD